MLIISRRVAERLYFGENKEITLEILGIDSDNVRIGISILSPIPICRGEVYQKYMHPVEKPIERVKL